MKNGLRTGIITLFILNLIACGGSDTNNPPSTTTKMEGLAECVPQPGAAVVCGTVLASDGITPLVNADISLLATGSKLRNRTTLANKGVANPDKCITDISGEFACLLPDGIAGDIDLVISVNGFNKKSISVTAVVENTVSLSNLTLVSNSDNRWVVIPGSFDGVQVLLAQLKGCTLNNSSGHPFDSSVEDAASARSSSDCESKGLIVLDDWDSSYLTTSEFTSNDALFVNCPSDYSLYTGVNEAVQNFVAAGKHVYFSDLSGSWLTDAFPGKISIAGNSTDTGNITATVTDAGLSNVIGSSINLEFDLPVWTAIGSVASDVTTFIEADITSVSSYSGVHPITVGWRDVSSSAGCVFYSSYHIEGASSASDQELAMKYLVQNINSVCN